VRWKREAGDAGAAQFPDFEVVKGIDLWHGDTEVLGVQVLNLHISEPSAETQAALRKHTSMCDVVAVNKCEAFNDLAQDIFRNSGLKG
jgi:hypothetical protein